MPPLPTIPPREIGSLFRSRAEARLAVFLAAADIPGQSVGWVKQGARNPPLERVQQALGLALKGNFPQEGAVELSLKPMGRSGLKRGLCCKKF
jgi:hypothetical protein